jgi:hypothetical protein
MIKAECGVLPVGAACAGTVPTAALAATATIVPSSAAARERSRRVRIR